jgi:hypothetical protein
MAVYERHKPESKVLYQSVARAWPKIEFEYATSDQNISPHVTAEFNRYREYWIPWDDLLGKTGGVDPEIRTCGARMVVDDAITEAEKIAEVLARLGIVSTGPPTNRQSKGELDYVFDV